MRGDPGWKDAVAVFGFLFLSLKFVNLRAAAAECKHAANNPTNIATHELLSGTLQLLANQTQNIKTCQHAIASRAVNEPSRKIHKVVAPTSAFTSKTGIRYYAYWAIIA